VKRAAGAELKRFLGSYSPEIAKIALRLRAAVLAEAPVAHELLDGASDSAEMGYAFTERRADSFCHIALRAHWVNLGFENGSQIPDPGGLLQGSGSGARHIRIATLDDLHQPHVGRFLRAAIRAAVRDASDRTEDEPPAAGGARKGRKS